jgi:hypothetical protein
MSFALLGARRIGEGDDIAGDKRGVRHASIPGRCAGLKKLKKIGRADLGLEKEVV